MDPQITDHDVFLFANHGATTMGATLAAAQQRMESLEHGARIVWIAQALGGARSLPREAVALLDGLRVASSARLTSNDSRSRS